MEKANEINGWQTQEIEVEQKEDKYKKNDMKKSTSDGKGGQVIKTGVRKHEAEVAKSLGYSAPQTSTVQITIGKNETL